MGYLLERAGLMDRLFGALRQLLGTVRGALYAATILVATLFAAATGSLGASVSIMGLQAVPVTRKAGYDTPIAACPTHDRPPPLLPLPHTRRHVAPGQVHA